MSGFLDSAGNEWPTEEQRNAWEWLFAHVDSITEIDRNQIVNGLTVGDTNLEDSYFYRILSGTWPNEWVTDHESQSTKQDE